MCNFYHNLMTKLRFLSKINFRLWPKVYGSMNMERFPISIGSELNQIISRIKIVFSRIFKLKQNGVMFNVILTCPAMLVKLHYLLLYQLLNHMVSYIPAGVGKRGELWVAGRISFNFLGSGKQTFLRLPDFPSKFFCHLCFL